VKNNGEKSKRRAEFQAKCDHFFNEQKNTSTMRWAVLHVRVLTIFFGITFQVGRFGWNTCWPQQCGAGFVVSFFFANITIGPGLLQFATNTRLSRTV
jgi:hypothetical protein